MTTGATGNGVTVDGRPCVDVPWFSADLMNGVMSPEVRDFLFFETTGKTDYTQTTIEGFVSGDLIKAPAGDIAAAVGVFYQRDEINDVPDDQVLAGMSGVHLQLVLQLVHNHPKLSTVSFQYR
jgi:hypothetical protein